MGSLGTSPWVHPKRLRYRGEPRRLECPAKPSDLGRRKRLKCIYMGLDLTDHLLAEIGMSCSSNPAASLRGTPMNIIPSERIIMVSGRVLTSDRSRLFIEDPFVPKSLPRQEHCRSHSTFLSVGLFAPNALLLGKRIYFSARMSQ